METGENPKTHERPPLSRIFFQGLLWKTCGKTESPHGEIFALSYEAKRKDKGTKVFQRISKGEKENLFQRVLFPPSEKGSDELLENRFSKGKGPVILKPVRYFPSVLHGVFKAFGKRVERLWKRWKRKQIRTARIIRLKDVRTAVKVETTAVRAVLHEQYA